MTIVPYEVAHFKKLVLQPGQQSMRAHVEQPGYAEIMVKGGQGYTAIDGNTILAISGIITQWENRALLWALISEEAGRHFVTIHRAALRFLEAQNYSRIEAFVYPGFAPGHRWVKMLGFKKESRMEKCSPDGSDLDLYVRIK